MRIRAPLVSVIAMVTLAVPALAGCSTGSNAVAPGNGGGNRYVAGDGRTVVYPAGSRIAAPEVSGQTLAGGSFSLASQRGRVVVINFWASWCAPCVLESSALEAVHESTKDSGVAFLGVDSRDQRDAALAFQTSRKIGYPSLFDPAGRIALQFRDVPSTLPTTLVIDRTGKIAAAVHAPVTRDALAALVAQVEGRS